MNQQTEKGPRLRVRILERLLISVIKEAEWRGAIFMKPVIEAVKAIEDDSPDKLERLEAAWLALRDVPSQKVALKL